MTKTRSGTLSLLYGLALGVLVGCPSQQPAKPRTKTSATCEQRAAESAREVAAALVKYDFCTTDVDCTFVNTGTQCGDSCGSTFNRVFTSEAAQAVADIDDKLCGDFEESGCHVAKDECANAVPSCQNKKCTTATVTPTCGDTVLTQASRSTRPAEDACTQILRLSPSSAADCHEVRLDIQRNRAEPPSESNLGTLTEQGLATVQELAEGLRGQKLEPIYGCPGCTDGAVITLSLLRDSVFATTEYGYGEAPTTLAQADAFVEGLIDALSTCQSSPMVKVAADCKASMCARP